MKKTIATLLILLAGVGTNAQHGSIAYQTVADSLFDHHHYKQAIDFYHKALKKSRYPGDIMLQVAKCYYKMNSILEAESWFVKSRQHDATFTSQDYYEFARVLTMLDKKPQADTLIERVLLLDPDNAVARRVLDDLRNFQKYYRDSASVSIRSLPINTTASEFSPVYFKEGIVFTSARPEGSTRKKSHWDDTHYLNLYYSRQPGDHQFQEPLLFEDDLDTRHHDGPAAFYSQYQKMIINRNQRIEVKGRKNVFEWRPGLYDVQFDKAKSSWQILPLPFNNPEYSFLHPSVSEDGNVLFFASDKPGGYGGTDIYRVVRINAVWGAPTNLGPIVNTAEDEAFPFLIDSTLYFASNGHGGLGGLDIFRSEHTNGEFTPPVNLGYPINSTADDFSLVSTSDQRNGYFASSRTGSDDLYSFKRLSVNQVLAMGWVKNTSDQFVDNFKATVTDKKTGDNISVQSGQGVMTFIGERGETYQISVRHEDYETAFQELKIPLVGPETEKFTVILENKSEESKLLVVDTDKGTTKMYVKTGESLNEITEKNNQLYLTTPLGSEFIAKGNISGMRKDPSPLLKELGIPKLHRSNLRNIYFDFDKSNLDNEDINYLMELRTILLYDRSLTLVVAGHADDRGEDDYNIELSKRRVQAVTKYLVSQGILKNRIVQKAYGESLPVVPCHAGDCSEDDHQRNRRAEFVLKYPSTPGSSPSSSKKEVKESSSKQR